MVKYDEMLNCGIYRVPMALPRTPKNKGMAVMLNMSSKDFTTSTLHNYKQFKNIQYIKSFYMDYKYKFKLFSKSIIEKIDNSELYKSIINDKTNRITKAYKMIKQYTQNNVFVGMYKYNEYFFNNIGNYKGDRVIAEYLKILNIVSNSLSEYDTKIMLIDLLDWGDDVKKAETYVYTKARTPLSILYCAMTRQLEEFKKLPFDILIVCGKYKIRIIPSQCTKDTPKELKSNLMKIIMSGDAKFMEEGDDDDYTDLQSEKETLRDKKYVVSTSMKNQIVPDMIYDTVPRNFTKDVKPTSSNETKHTTEIKDDCATSKTAQYAEELEDEIEKAVDDTVMLDDDIDPDEAEKKAKELLNNNDDFLTKLDLVSSDLYTNVSVANTKRNQLLMEKQAKLKINKEGKTIEQILNNTKDKILEPEPIPIDTLNEDMKEMKFPFFSKAYNDKLGDKDVVAILNFFSTKRYPVYILDIKKEDTSDDFNKKFTYTVKMESADRERHTLKFDMPKFVDDSFMYLGGNKKNILCQYFLLPVSKTGPDTVQLCSNYNKIFIRRAGTKVSPKIERMKKALGLYKGVNARSEVFFKVGDNSSVNSAFLTNIEYDELAKEYMNVYINVGQDRYNFYFNQNNIRNYINEHKIKFTDREEIIPICIKNDKEIIFLNSEKDMVVGTNKGLIDYMNTLISKQIPSFAKDFANINVGKKYIYTEATIMAQKIPTLLLVSYLEGLTTVLKKADINFRFSDTRENLKLDDKNNKELIQFADGYLIYDRYPMKNSLLLDAFSILPTKSYNYEDFDKKETYLEIFDDLYGNKKILNAFENFYDLFIDPITLEVLKDYNLPTGFVELVLYANELLQDNQFVRETHMSHYRLRTNEVPNALLYKTLADAYSVYRGSVGNKHPKKMSIPEDMVIRELMTEKIVEDYSTLNPALEAEKLRAGTFKGPSGMNMARAYTLDKRAYDKSMKGILAMSSPPSGSIGIVRQMPMEVNVISPRGYLKIADDLDELNSANMFCPSELLTPGTAQFDDGARVAMTTSQTKHIVPAKKYNELLIANGADKALAQVISNDFAFKAKNEGKVIEIDESTEVMVVEYKDKTTDVIDLGGKIAKNGGGGFFIANKLDTDMKVGQKFKKGDILAVNKKFFNTADGDATYKSGTMAKVAIMSGYYTYEDSAMVTEKLSRDMTANVVMKKDVVLGKNSNISFIVKKGDRVEVGDPLVVFDESFEDDSINKLLANMSADVKDQINAIGKVPVKSKYSGIIEDVKIYYTVDKDELSPSMRKVIDNINKENIAKRKLISKYVDVNKSDLILDPVTKIDAKYGKVKGVDVGEGVLIEFYVNYADKMGVGDKITFFTALKTVICKVVPEGQEPYSEFRKDEEISAFLSPISYLARMTKSIETQLFGNKALIELKRKLKDIYES